MALYNDNFTGVNGTLLTSHTADSGATYIGDSGIEIYNNRIHNSNSSTNYVDSDITSDGEYDLDVTFVTQSDTEGLGITFGKVDNDNFYLVRLQAGVLQLYKWVAGTPTSLGTYTPSITPPAILDNVKIKVRSGSINIDYGVSVDVITSTDTALSRVGVIGYRGNGNSATNTGHFIDSVLYTNQAASGPTITDFEGGNTAYPGQVGNVNGSGFEAVQGAGFADISNVTQPNSGWSDTSIPVTITQGGLKYGAQILTVTNDSAEKSDNFNLTLIADPTQYQYIDAVNPITGLVGGEVTSVFFGTSAITGDQWESDLVTSENNPIQQNPDGTFVIIGGGQVLETFSVRLWDQTDETWSTREIQTINGTIIIGDGPITLRPLELKQIQLTPISKKDV